MKKILYIFLFCWSYSLVAQHQGLTFYVNGENLRRANKFDAAIKEFNNALQKEPTNHQYLYAKAQCEYKLRQDDAAMQTLGTAIKHKEDFVDGYLLMADIAKNGNKMTEACRYYDLAFKYEKDVAKRVDYKMFIMNKYIKEKNISAAFENIKEAKDVAPNNDNVIYYYAKLSNILGKYNDAKEAIIAINSHIPSMKPDDAAKFYYELGYAYFHLEAFQDADATFKKINVTSYASKVEKFTPKYFCSLALAYFKFHENALSKQYVEKAVKIQQGYPLAHVLMAQLSKRNNDHKSTITHLESAVTHEKNVMKKIDLYDKIADMQLELGQFDACITTVEKSLELKADDHNALFTKYLAFYRRGDFQGCINGINATLKAVPDDAQKADFNFLLGLCYKKLNDKAKAKSAFYSAAASSLKDAAELEMENLTN